MCFTGHRSIYDFGIFDNYGLAKVKLIKILYDEIINQIETHRDHHITFRSGGAIFIDQLAFELVDKIKTKYKDVVIINEIDIPYIKQHEKWNKKQQEYYNNLKRKADKVVYVDEQEGYMVNGIEIGEYHVAKLELRNRYMVDHSDIVIACWNDKKQGKSGTRNCVKYADKCNKNIRIINI